MYSNETFLFPYLCLFNTLFKINSLSLIVFWIDFLQRNFFQFGIIFIATLIFLKDVESLKANSLLDAPWFYKNFSSNQISKTRLNSIFENFFSKFLNVCSFLVCALFAIIFKIKITKKIFFFKQECRRLLFRNEKKMIVVEFF